MVDTPNVAQANADPVASIDWWTKNTTFMNMGGHPVEITKAGGPLQSALFYCRGCRTGFHRNAVRGRYSSPQPCPAMEEIWNGIRPAWRRWLDLRVDGYTMRRQAIKHYLRRTLK